MDKITEASQQHSNKHHFVKQVCHSTLLYALFSPLEGAVSLTFSSCSEKLSQTATQYNYCLPCNPLCL